MKAYVTIIGGILLALGLASQASAATRAGMHRCYVESGTGFVVDRRTKRVASLEATLQVTGSGM